MINLVCVGVSGMGKHHWTTASKMKEFKIVAGVDLNAAAREAFTSQTGAPTFDSIEKAMENVAAEAAVIATPDKFHAPLSILAMEKGLDVLCEKPMAESMDDAQRMHATSQRLGRVLMIHNQLRWYAPYCHARRLVREGAIGDLHSLALDMYVYSEAFFVGYRSRLPHAILQDLAIHHLDMIRYLTGQDGKTILVRDWKTTEDGAESPTTTSAFALLEMTGKVNVSYRTTNRALLDPTGYLPRAVLTGTRGVLKVTDSALALQTFAGMKATQPEETIKPEAAPRDAWGAFADSIQTREPSLTASGDNIQSLRLMFAAMRSADTGTVVTVDPG
ncbi:MAG: hypothetical protein A3K19_16825 [Lentisphaerae bacterium RIFOXYB12_FULL_65_16]|nr:MAG: hypothetical protein A3K18_19450 [Lentisphaerae bacterium RIFOXYA12_64_32]OGV88981.1 MAG: hypothetical protein A3K19_16825 [Lentisphaerae bacterium RIFOXYB12_FULL_65_16]